MLIAGCSSNIVTENNIKRQEEKSLKTNYEQQVSINYLLYLPKDYKGRDKYPVMMFLHGSGERGNNLELVEKHGPPKLINQGKDFPFIVVSPQCPLGIRWKTNELIALLDDIIKNYNVDENRIYITGLSMGGYGTWKLANEIPERLAAIIPICGWGDTWTICEIGDLPVWAFHGAKDNVVDPRKSQELVDALKACNGNAKLTLYPEANHDSWTQTYDNPEIYEWLLKQTKDQRKKLNSNWF
ncbi:MAG: prolyl oligopeptidase family serine peptidase [Ignavibacteriales bacterium]|nr:prolyl oligopeptidase family serine peptidase [Ignavibacteriales bacterium]